MEKIMKKIIICGIWRIFLNNGQFKCSGQTRDSRTTITKQNSCVSSWSNYARSINNKPYVNF